MNALAADSLAGAPAAAAAAPMALLALKAALLLALFALAAWGLRRLKPRLKAGGGDRPLEVISALSLGPRRQAVLLRAGGRVLLLGLGEGGVRPLGRFDGDEAEQLIALAQGGARPFRVRMAQALGREAGDADDS